jgi:threonine/homoserine/homoserine lactone efflux protein
MELAIFLKGLIAGLVVCAPVGPIGLLCVRRTLMDGRMAGLVSVLGASTADGLFCLIAGLGVTYIANLLMNEQTAFTLLGGIILIALGVKLFFTQPGQKTPDVSGKGLLDAYVSSFLLMLANPMLIFVFSAAFTALGVHGWKGDYLSTAILVAGVFLGSALWAPLLVAAVSLFRPQFGPRQQMILNRVSGVIIFGFGVAAGILSLIK